MRTGLNLGHSNGRIHNLAQEAAGERAHGSLGSAVHATARVRFPSRDRSDVDDMARVAGLEVYREGVLFSVTSRRTPSKREKEKGAVGGKGTKARETDRPLTRSCVREMRPKTFVANMVSMSLSWISPTRSTPWAAPALLTAVAAARPITFSERGGSEVEPARVCAAKSKCNKLLTEDVDVAELLRYLRPQRGHLGPVCHIELHGGDFRALLDAHGAGSLCDCL